MKAKFEVVQESGYHTIYLHLRSESHIGGVSFRVRDGIHPVDLADLFRDVSMKLISKYEELQQKERSGK